MILDTTNKKVQFLLDANVASSQLNITADWVDITSTTTTPGSTFSTSNNVTAVDIIPAPSASTQRVVKYISICNTDTDFVNLTVRLNDNGTTYNYVGSFLLAVNSTLQYTDAAGWTVIDAAGNIVIATGAVRDIQVFSSNGTWTKPQNATYCLVDLCGAGGSGGGGSSNGTNSASSGGGGGGKRMQMLFLASDLPSSIGVLVGAGGLGVAQQTDGNTGGNTVFGNGSLQVGNNTYDVNLIAYGGGGGAFNSGTAAGGGGGGGGGTGAGASATSTGAAGGAAFLTSAAGTTYADDRGAGGGSSAIGSNSYLGGGGGGSGTTTATSYAGGSSAFSAGGGGGGGAVVSGVTNNGGDGGNSGMLTTAAGGGGAAGTGNGGAGSPGANGDFSANGMGTKMGQGGGGGASGTVTGGAGGAGGSPGGGGGGGGGGSTTGGAGGAGGNGRAVVFSW